MKSSIKFDVPGGATALVHIIDTSVRMTGLPVSYLLSPEVNGFKTLPPLASWAFLVESSTGRKVLFDLSMPPDSSSYPPAAVELLASAQVTVEPQKHAADVLKENDVDPGEIKSVIWSHHHWDHIGDITTFPTSTELVVGPGFKDAFLPGYPSQPDNILEERHFKDRVLREINFTNGSDDLKIGDFRAYDFFGDGSFYLLDTPGHDIGHLAGLARTTINPDTFILMGGDICHHGGEVRPSPDMPIPDNIKFCSEFKALNARHGRQTSGPFFDPVLVNDMERTMQTIKGAQTADAQDNVFFIFAHAMEILGVVDFFPQLANEWKMKGWKERTMWKFLSDLEPAIARSE